MILVGCTWGGDYAAGIISNTCVVRVSFRQRSFKASCGALGTSVFALAWVSTTPPDDTGQGPVRGLNVPWGRVPDAFYNPCSADLLPLCEKTCILRGPAAVLDELHDAVNPAVVITPRRAASCKASRYHIRTRQTAQMQLLLVNQGNNPPDPHILRRSRRRGRRRLHELDLQTPEELAAPKPLAPARRRLQGQHPGHGAPLPSSQRGAPGRRRRFRRSTQDLHVGTRLRFHRINIDNNASPLSSQRAAPSRHHRSRVGNGHDAGRTVRHRNTAG